MKRHPNRILIATGILLGLAAVWQQRAASIPAGPAPAVAVAVAATPAPPPAAAEVAPPAPRVRPLAGAAVQAPAVDPVFARFDDWTRRYLAQPVAGRAALLHEGRELAAARRAVLAQLIRTDPRVALEAAVPMVMRQQLPPEILELLEERVAARGDLAFLGATPMPGQPAREALFRTASVNGNEYRAHVFGRREVPGTVGKTSMNGIALDGHFAIAESPVRVLEPGEIAGNRPLNAICDVSGTATPVGPDTPLNTAAGSGGATALEYDGVVHVLCGANHLAQTESLLLAREESNLAAANAVGTVDVVGRPAMAWTHGPKRLLVLRVDFSDHPGIPMSYNGSPMTEDNVANLTAGVQQFYTNNSFGKTALNFAPATNGDSPDVSPVLRMPQPGTYYEDNNGTSRPGQLHLDARAAAQAAGINVSAYDRVCVAFSGLNYWWAGLGEITGRNFWINGYYDFKVVAHELGHTYGMMHANIWWTNDGNTISPAGFSQEYGDGYDVMGSGNSANPEFSHWNKSIVQWIPDSAVQSVTASGIYRVYRLDHAAPDLSLPRALKVRRNDQQDYWIGYRRSSGNVKFDNGAYILWGYHTNQQGNLLDMTPNTAAVYDDAPLPIGATFTDAGAAVAIKTLARGGSEAGEWLDMQVTIMPSVRWSQTTEYVAGEQEGTAQLRVQRYGDTATALSVNYATTGGPSWEGRATAGQDYVETSGTLNWAAGDTTERLISVPIIGDSMWEGGERFAVTLSGAPVAGNATIDVDIVDPGLRDLGFKADSAVDRVFAAVVQPDGNILVGGPFQQVRDQQFQSHDRRGLAQLSPDGRLQPGFTTGVSGNRGWVRDLVLHGDGRVLVVGSFQSVGEAPHANVARLNADGTVDATFTASTNGEVCSVLVQPDGRILLGGEFTAVNGVPREYVARLNADGSLDTTFTGPNFDGSGSYQVIALALQPDGRIVAGGAFLLSNGVNPRRGVCRLMPSGGLDPAFVVREGAGSNVMAVAIQADGRILIGGDFTAYDAVARGRIARLNVDGSLDASFTASLDGRCNALLSLADGRIVAGGWFFAANGTATRNLVLMSSSGVLDPHVVENGGAQGEVYDFQLLANQRIQFASSWDTFQGNEAGTLWRMISGVAASAGSLQFAGTTAAGTEGGTVTLAVSRTGGARGPVSVGYSAAPGTAAAVDYANTNGTLAWADGDAAAKTITIALASDNAAEPAETFTVNLSNPAGGATLGAASQATVTIEASGGPPPPTGDWTAGDVGATGAAGSSSESGGVATVTGSGADIWGSADAFQFRHQQFTGDGSIIVRVASMGNTHPWAKVGIMFRENLTPGSREVMAFVSPGNHSGLQYRLEPGAQSAMGADLWSGLPVWLMLVRSGDTFGGYRSYNGVDWTPLGTINCNLPDTAYVGFAVSSHVAGTLLTATFDNIEVTGTEPPPPENPPTAPDRLTTNGATASTVSLSWRDNSSDETGFAIERAPGFSTTFAEVGTAAANSQAFMDTGLTANTTYTYRVRAQRGSVYSSYSDTTLITTSNQPPSAWQGLDIGNVGPGGSETVADPNITVRAGGTDIWGTADGFRYVYRAWTGDGEIRARVASLTNTHAWAKAGVMFRESLGADARNVAYLLTAANSSGLQARAATGGETTFTNGPWVNAPYWVRLVRSGNTFTAYSSPDGVAWTARGTQTVTMGASIYVGVAVSAHTATVMTTAVFESVQLPGGEPPPPPPSDWTQTSLGAATGSFTTPQANAMTISSTGADLWGQADDGLFVHREWSGDGAVTVRLDSLGNTHPWAKAGIMLRENTGAGSRNVFVGLTATNGATFQIRGAASGATTEVNHSWLPGAPCWLRLTRAGDILEAFFSVDGTAWTKLGSIGVMYPNAMRVGLAVSSHATASTTAVFTNLSLPSSPPPPPPSDWQQATWGAATGSFTKTGSPSTSVNIDVTATGADIWGQSDDGFYVHQVWQGSQGDGVMAVRVDSMTNTHPWAKAGLMFRETTAAASANVFLAVTPGVGITLQVRSASGAVTTEAQHSWAAGVPCYLRLNRSFDRTLTAEFSANGTNWTTLATIADPLTRTTNIYGGVAVSSHTGTAISVRFTGVSMQWAI